MRCSKFNTTLSVAACLIRQKMARNHNPKALTEGDRYLFCLDCPDGELARKGKMGDEDVEAMKTAKSMEQRAEGKTQKPKTWIPDPVRDDGNKKIGQASCLTDRSDGPAGEKDMDGKLKCSRCREMKDPEQFGPDKKAANHGFRRYFCKPCEAEGQRERMANKKAQGAGLKVQGEKQAPEKSGPAKLPERFRLRPNKNRSGILPDTKPDKPVLILDFTPCLPVLVKIEETAAQELRTPANQCLVFLREFFKDVA